MYLQTIRNPWDNVYAYAIAGIAHAQTHSRAHIANSNHNNNIIIMIAVSVPEDAEDIESSTLFEGSLHTILQMVERAR